jgi:hypothetical protein
VVMTESRISRGFIAKSPPRPAKLHRGVSRPATSGQLHERTGFLGLPSSGSVIRLGSCSARQTDRKQDAFLLTSSRCQGARWTAKPELLSSACSDGPSRCRARPYIVICLRSSLTDLLIVWTSHPAVQGDGSDCNRLFCDLFVLYREARSPNAGILGAMLQRTTAIWTLAVVSPKAILYYLQTDWQDLLRVSPRA